MSMMEFQQEQAKTLRNIDDQVGRLGRTMRELVNGTSIQNRQDAQDLKKYILTTNWVPSESMQAAAMGNIDHRYGASAFEISHSLTFETIHHREWAIPMAHAETFGWIFQEPRKEDGKPMWSDFRKWMTGSDNTIYWISGKAGAGKSTLIKFLLHDSRVKADLKRWAGEHRLLLATYYSWNAGNELQKSQEGLLRSLLYQCLSIDPIRFVPLVFPSRWALIQLLNLDPSVTSWTTEELLLGLRNLLAHAGRKLADDFEPYKLAVVIDGLDEFQGNHQRLLEIITDASSQHHIKICVSSRPWNVFRDALNQSPTLRLELLTQKDIEQYVREKFSHSLGYQESEALFPHQTKKLVSDILLKAQGVFLWVSLVVRELLQRLQEGSKLSDLQAVLDKLPGDISRLFQLMYERTNEKYRGEAAQLFLLLEKYEEFELVPYVLSVWMGMESEDSALDLGSEFNSQSSRHLITNIVSALRRLLDSRTRGLLEVYDNPDASLSRVDYMHRTVREWAHENLGSLMAAIKPDFDPYLWLLRGEKAFMPVRYLAAGKKECASFLPHLQTVSDVAYKVASTAPGRSLPMSVVTSLDQRLARLMQVLGRGGAPLLDEHYSVGIRLSRLHWCGSPTIDKENSFYKVRFIGGEEKVPDSDHSHMVKINGCSECVEPKTIPPCEDCRRAELPAIPLIVNAIFGGYRGSPVYGELGGNFLDHQQRLGLLPWLLEYSEMDEVEGVLEILQDEAQLDIMMGVGRGTKKDDLGNLGRPYIETVIRTLIDHRDKELGKLSPGLFLDGRSVMGAKPVARSAEADEIVSCGKCTTAETGNEVYRALPTHAQGRGKAPSKRLVRILCCLGL